MLKIRNFPAILNNTSKYFSFENCKFANEKYKKNCARLAVVRDFNIFHSYTIESSCWGYSIPYSDDTVQFTPKDFLIFGKQLAMGIARQFQIKVTPEEIETMKPGLDISLDFALKSDDLEEKKKVTKKKTGKITAQ